MYWQYRLCNQQKDNFHLLSSIWLIWLFSSVASCLVLGGGGKTPECTDKNNICTYIAWASEGERAPQKHIFSGLQIHLHTIMSYTINAVSFNYLWYGAIYTTLYCKDTKIKKNIWICERASLNSVISLIILLVLQIISLRNIYFQVSNNICIHNTQSMHFPYITYSMMLYYINDSIPTKHLHWENVCDIMRASGASELRKCSHFHILKLLFPSIFCSDQ